MGQEDGSGNRLEVSRSDSATSVFGLLMAKEGKRDRLLSLADCVERGGCGSRVVFEKNEAVTGQT